MKLKEKLKKKQPEKKNKGISEKKSFKEKLKSSFNGKYIKMCIRDSCRAAEGIGSPGDPGNQGKASS